MRCMVTGGAGFIGSHLVDALIERGDVVTVLDDLSTGRSENLAGALSRGASLHEIDVRRAADVEALFDTAEPEVVFHLAAQIDVRHSVENPRADAVTNVLGMVNVLEAGRRVGVRRLVNSSTGGALYGDAELIPTPEGAPIRPLAPYGQGKYAAEGYAQLYAGLHGLSSISLRYSNVYGPRQDSHGEAGVVAIFCGCLRAGRPVTIFGDGNQTRDLVEVSDVVRANLAAAESDLTGAVNIATNHETSVLELVEILSQIGGAGAGLEARFAPARPGEVMRSRLDISRARDELGWQPRVELRDGLSRFLDAV